MAAEPLRKVENPYDNDNSSEQVTRPNLRSLEGGGETTEPRRGHLKAVGDDASSASPDELKDSETSGEGPAASKADQTEGSQLAGSDQLGRGFNPTDKKPRKNRLLKWLVNLQTRQKVIGGGVIGIIIAAIVFLSTIITGPLQFIHIAQLLQRFHFLSQQDTGNSRILKLYKWARNVPAGTPENTRLGFIGKRVAKNIDDQLEAIGITKKYDHLGNYEGTVFDSQKYSEAHEDFCRGCDAKEFMAKMEEENGIKLKSIGGEQSGQFLADDQSGIFDYFAKFKNRSFNKLLLQDINQDGVVAALQARVMGKRDAVTWHPIKRLDSKITGTIDQKLSAWLAELKDRIKNGAPPEEPASATGGEVKDQNNKTDEAATADNQKGASAVDTVSGEAAGVAQDSEREVAQGKIPADVGPAFIKQFTESTTGKVTLGGTAALGLACAADGIAQKADELKHSLVVLPLLRMGVQAISLGNQVMSGQDLDEAQLGFFSKLLSDANGVSWADAGSIQAELGQPLTGPDMPSSDNPGKIGENMFSQFFSYFPGLDTVCKATSSGIGGFAMTIVNVVTGPIQFAGSLVLAQTGALNSVVSSLVRWIAGSPVPTVVFGPQYGNFINYGARLAANDQAASMGGVKLSSAQALQFKNYELAMQSQTMAHEPIALKVFDPYSPDSLIGKAIDNVPANSNSNVASFFSSLINPLHIMAALKSPFSSRVMADSTYDYGFPQIGFSLSDLSSVAYDNPYANADNAKALLSGSGGQDYRDRAQNCFGVTIAPDGGDVTTNFSQKVDPLDKDYDKNDATHYCSDPSPNWTSIRFYVLDMKMAEAADCYVSGDDQSCTDSGFGNATNASPASANTTAGSSIVGNIGESSDSVACANGTKDLGVATSKYSGSQKTTPGPLLIRLCQLSSIGGNGNDANGQPISGGAVVNSRVSGAWQALGQAAKAQGLNLSATSSFRLNDSCGGKGDGTLCARPGQSIHQLGVAIDFAGTHVTGSSSANCSGRARDPSSPVWSWLYQNAQQFGFRQYTYESWHWDSLTDPSRCGTNQ